MVRVEEKKINEFATAAFRAIGVPEEDAKMAAKLIINTEKRGVVTHGLAKLSSFYVYPTKNQAMNAKADVKVLAETASTASLDGDKGLGFVVGSKAMKLAVEKAKQTGVGIVNVRNIGHFGSAMNYPLLAVEDGMIGFCMTDTPPWMAAPGTGNRTVGTNPFSFAAPAGEKDSFVIDMSTTVVAAAKLNTPDHKIPAGWLIDKKGNSITDTSGIDMAQAALLPTGSDPIHGAYKGYGLGIMVEILTSILTGSHCAMLKGQDSGRGAGYYSLFGAINIEVFTSKAAFNAMMDEMIDAFENLPDKLPGVDKLYVPGGRSAEKLRDCEQNGIPLSEEVIEDHRALGKDLGIAIDY